MILAGVPKIVAVVIYAELEIEMNHIVPIERKRKSTRPNIEAEPYC